MQQVFQRFSGSLQKILEDIDRRVAVVEAAEQSSSACAASATARTSCATSVLHLTVAGVHWLLCRRLESLENRTEQISQVRRLRWCLG